MEIDSGDGVGPSALARDQLYRMWELPAAAYLLWGIAGKQEAAHAVGTMVEAFRTPLEHEESLAAIHATPLGLRGMKIPQWLGFLRRLVSAHSEDFAPIFDFPEDQLPPPESPPPFLEHLQDAESYAALTAVQRLKLLHTTAEIAASDPQRFQPDLHKRPIEELRPAPLGKDSAGNVYWYFNDATHVYREPSPKKKSSAPTAKATAAALAANKAEAAVARKAKQEERRIAAEKRKAEKEERARKREEERERKRMEARAKWAPRHPNARVTRGSRAAEKAAVQAAMRETEQSNGVTTNDSSATANGTNPTANRDSHEGNTNSCSEDVEIVAVTSQPVEPESTASASAGASTSGADLTLRACTGWECVCASLGELLEFAERFGSLGTVKGAVERALVRRINNELRPMFEDREKRVERERRKAMMNEWRSVRKRSARVAAINAERETEQLAERQAKREARRLIKTQDAGNEVLDRNARRLAREAERERIVAEGQAKKRKKRLSVKSDEDENEDEEEEVIEERSGDDGDEDEEQIEDADEEMQDVEEEQDEAEDDDDYEGE